jgi:hypothetical protein
MTAFNSVMINRSKPGFMAVKGRAKGRFKLRETFSKYGTHFDTKASPFPVAGRVTG